MRKGFTLIEILLALAIFAILLSVTGVVVVQTLRASEALETTGADARLASALLDRIGADLKDAVLLGTDDPANFVASSTPSGMGREIRVDLVTLADAQPDDLGRSADFTEAGYLYRSRDGFRWDLYRREQALVDLRPTQGGEFLLLTDRLASLEIRYTKDGLAWQDAYDSRAEGRLPWAVQVSFTLAPATEDAKALPVAYERTFFLDRWGYLPAGQ